MGREVRRVIPNWEHPKKEVPNYRTGMMIETYQSMHDRDFESAMQQWLDDLKQWMDGEFEKVRLEYPDEYKADEPYRAFVEWNGLVADPEYYRPKWGEGEATWYQLYETVSEGAPVSPPFETPEELAHYLAQNGDFWYQQDQREGRETFRTKPTFEQAMSLVNAGWAMSGMMVATSGCARLLDAYEQQDVLREEKQ